MRTETREVFIAFDDTVFDTADECAAYEKQNSSHMLEGLTWQQLHEAFQGQNEALADAIEKFGRQIAKARLERGERKRKPKGAVVGKFEGSGATLTVLTP